MILHNIKVIHSYATRSILSQLQGLSCCVKADLVNPDGGWPTTGPKFFPQNIVAVYMPAPYYWHSQCAYCTKAAGLKVKGPA